MEYTYELAQKVINKIRNENHLKWSEMAELFGYKKGNSVLNIAAGRKPCSREAFEKHFGPIEQYFEQDSETGKTVEKNETPVIVKPAEVIAHPKKKGIVLSCDSLTELKELLNSIGYHMEFVAI